MKKQKKRNTISPATSLKVKLMLLAPFVVACIVIAIHIAFDKVRKDYLEQCVIRDVNEQILVEDADKLRMVSPEAIVEKLGLKNGVNLSDIDFDEMRSYVLKEVPQLLDLSIARRLPDKLTIRAVERVPIARVRVLGHNSDNPRKNSDWRVTDTEGVVFIFRPGTQNLPIIHESANKKTGNGGRLDDLAMEAIRIIEEAKCDDLKDRLTIKYIDSTAKEYHTITFATTNEAVLKLSWEGRGENSSSPSARASLHKRLQRFADSYETAPGAEKKYWDATSYDNEITAGDSKGRPR